MCFWDSTLFDFNIIMNCSIIAVVICGNQAAEITWRDVMIAVNFICWLEEY
jgi:hypothetical protein